MDAKTRAVANFFIRKAMSDYKNDMSIMKLVKLMYFAQGWSLALLDRALFPEKIEAWQYGPVVPSVYRARKTFGAEPIHSLFLPIENGSEIDQEELEVLEKVYKNFGSDDALQLSALTHISGSPWDQAYPHTKTISLASMREYFKSLRKKS